ncbi:MAG: hypothetical protein L6Q37_13845 [Bdellovibrionaceae bacterium]|nr:hypothetical protein [Pseudobdellovibrionaceae bacterium]
MNFVSLLVSLILILSLNLNIVKLTSLYNHEKERLICPSENNKFLTFGFSSQTADILWLQFLQEIEAYNENKIAKPFLCADGTSSWHFHILNLAMELDPKFYELTAIGPLVVSVTINDSKGASLLFDKAVTNFPNDWRILYQAAYQSQVEEKNLKKTAELFHRAASNGAPRWVYSLAGGIYNEIGMVQFADSIYRFLADKFPEDEVTKRLKNKLQNKVKNFFEKK